MCDIWYQLEKYFASKEAKKMDIRKFGYVIKIRVDTEKDLQTIYDTMLAYYKDFKYNEIVIQMRQSNEGGDRFGKRKEEECEGKE